MRRKGSARSASGRNSTNDSRVFKGRIAQWKLKGMDPPRLASDPGPKISTLQPTTRLVRALTYNLQWPSCKEYLTEILDSGWVLNALESADLDEDVLETLLLLADCTEWLNDDLIELFWYELVGRIPTKFQHAFDRVLQVPPKLLDIEAALVELGFTEILESIDRLQSKEEIEFYVNSLTEPQFRELQQKLDVKLSRQAIVAWTQPREFPGPVQQPVTTTTTTDSDISSSAIIIRSDPPMFRNTQSMLQWHLDYLISCNATEAMQTKWLSIFDKGDLLMNLWPKTDSELNSSPVPQKITGKRILVLQSSSGINAGTAGGQNLLFYNTLHGEYLPSAEVAGLLRSKAGESNAVFGNSLRAASVAFRRDNDYESAALCGKLEPIELLKNDLDRYLVAIGADLAIVDVAFAAESDVSGYDTIIWPAQAFYDPLSRIRLMQVLARNGFDQWGDLAEPLDLLPPPPVGIQGFDSSGDGGGRLFAAVKLN